jgi:hypothetical protein
MCKTLGALLLLALLTACATADSAAIRPASAANTIKVHVFEPVSRGDLPGVRVFVLDRNGKQLFSTTSDGAGVSRLPLTIARLRPRYVLAELAGFYVVGHLWNDDVTEYEIPLAVAAPQQGMRIVQ